MIRLSFAPLLLCLVAPLAAGTLRFLPWDDAVATRKLGVESAGKLTEIKDLHPSKRSGAYPATAGEVPIQLVAIDRKTDDGKPVATEIKIPEGVDTPLALLMPDPKDPTGIRVVVIADSSKNFPWGTSRFINATGVLLLVRHDKIVKALPKTWTPVDISSGGGTRNIGVSIAAESDRAKILYSAVWEQNPDIRKLIFIAPSSDTRTGALLIKNIPEDRRSIPPPAPSKGQ
jgi:hypothetical protein